MKRRLLILIASGLLMLFGALAASNRPTNIYASIEIEAGISKAHAHKDIESKWFNITCSGLISSDTSIGGKST